MCTSWFTIVLNLCPTSNVNGFVAQRCGNSDTTTTTHYGRTRGDMRGAKNVRRRTDVLVLSRGDGMQQQRAATACLRKSARSVFTCLQLGLHVFTTLTRIGAPGLQLFTTSMRIGAFGRRLFTTWRNKLVTRDVHCFATLRDSRCHVMFTHWVRNDSAAISGIGHGMTFAGRIGVMIADASAF